MWDDTDSWTTLRTKSPWEEKKARPITHEIYFTVYRESGLKCHSAASMGDHSMVSESQHFPSFDDRARASTRNMVKNRSVSPAHSAHGSLIRSSLVRISSEKKAKKVRFYRNGDRFFKGILYAVSPERFRSFESLLAELTTSPMCDKSVLPKGVRHIFSIDGSKKITNLDELDEGESYVCASTQLFHKINYPKNSSANWNPNIARGNPESRDTTRSSGYKFTEPEDRDFIKPKLITVVRNGSKPRRAVRILLNRKTAHSFDQVLNDITNAIQLDSGAVKRIFTVSGRPVTCLQEFFQDETTFVAYGHERYALDDFDLDNNEIKFGGAYRSVRQKERITLKSPKAPRRVLLASTKSADNSFNLNGTSNKTPGRRTAPVSVVRPKSPVTKKAPLKLVNGNGNITNGDHIDELPPTLDVKYSIGKIIGEGNFATVKECRHKVTKAIYALKVIHKARFAGKEKMIENEVAIMRNLQHPNVIQLIEEIDTQDAFYLVMELVSGGDLFDAIGSATKYTERDASGMLYNLGCAIKYLHSLSIVHRDIKPENLLVAEYPDGSKALKLGDFGLATIVTGPLLTVCGTPTYVAPEVLAETGYGIPVDIWSAGVITYILLCGFPPFVSPTNNQEELFDKILTSELEYISPFWDTISDSAKELICQMLNRDVESRLTADEVLNHPWVSEDDAKDEDLANTVSTTIEKNFMKKTKKYSEKPGVALITSTALDKGSRFFEGKKHRDIPSLSNGHDEQEDEVF